MNAKTLQRMGFRRVWRYGRGSQALVLRQPDQHVSIWLDHGRVRSLAVAADPRSQALSAWRRWAAWLGSPAADGEAGPLRVRGRAVVIEGGRLRPQAWYGPRRLP